MKTGQNKSRYCVDKIHQSAKLWCRKNPTIAPANPGSDRNNTDKMNINETKSPKQSDKHWAGLFGYSNVIARLDAAKSRAYRAWKNGRKTAGSRFDRLHAEIEARS
jgi:hypothetical protein